MKPIEEKNLSCLDRQPVALKEKVFEKLFEEAEIAKFSKTELKEYEDSLKAYRDVKNSIDTALERGREEGLAKGREEGERNAKKQMALNLLSLGVPIKTVAQASGLTEEDIENLEKE